MVGRKSKREEVSIELDAEEPDFFIEAQEVEMGAGYALSFNYDDHEKPIIDVKTYGKVDLQKLRREIVRIYPKARIRQLNDQRYLVSIAAKKPRNK